MSQALERWNRGRLFAPGTLVHVVAATHNSPVAAHDHEFVEIVLVKSGKARHMTARGEESLAAGDVLTLRPGVWHSYTQVERLAIWNCCFGPELLQRELAWALEDPALGPLLWGPRDAVGGAGRSAVLPSRLRDCQAPLRELEAAIARGREGRAALIGRLLVCLDTLTQNVSPSVQSAAEAMPAMVARSVRLLESDLARDWRISDLATPAGVDGAYLTRRFTAALGRPPMTYLAQRRAERAAALLRGTPQPIARIAQAVGWEDPVYFARRFRKHYGMTAGEYRQRFTDRAAPRTQIFR